MSGIIGGAGSRSGVIGTTELDYEEGTFTATLKGGDSEPGTLITSDYLGRECGLYTKIGDLVHIHIAFYNKNTTGYSGQVYIQGFPFTPLEAHGFTIASYNMAEWTDQLSSELNATALYLNNMRTDATWIGATHGAKAGCYLYITGTYKPSS